MKKLAFLLLLGGSFGFSYSQSTETITFNTGFNQGAGTYRANGNTDESWVHSYGGTPTGCIIADPFSAGWVNDPCGRWITAYPGSTSPVKTSKVGSDVGDHVFEFKFNVKCECPILSSYFNLERIAVTTNFVSLTVNGTAIPLFYHHQGRMFILHHC